jgi:hypothetical protein
MEDVERKIYELVESYNGHCEGSFDEGALYIYYEPKKRGIALVGIISGKRSKNNRLQDKKYQVEWQIIADGEIVWVDQEVKWYGSTLLLQILEGKMESLHEIAVL